MPFKSKAQRRWMYANHPTMAERWSKHTPKTTKLPEYIKSEKTANMTTQQQAYINGFVKRAAEYGYNEYQAINILKQASELKGDQHKLDVDHNGKIEGSDLKKLRKLKQAGALGDLMNSAGTAYNNYVNSKNTPTPADLAANQRARANYVKQMPRQPAGQQLPPPVQVAPQK
jgi:hypothetical protein